jgi:RNA polymerase sigma-70 factor (sigma-E family)
VQVTEETYADLARTAVPALLRLAVMLTGSAPDAEDLVQATLLRGTRHGERIAAMQAPMAYLRRILVNEHTSRGRSLQRRIRTVPLSALPHDPAVGPDVDIEARDQTWRWLATLPARQRAVLVLRFYEDLPDPEIADILGCSEGTVRSNASRGLATLRAHLEEQER